MPRKIACRYGKNGYFGICCCDKCLEMEQALEALRIENAKIDAALNKMPYEKRLRALKSIVAHLAAHA